MWFLNEFLLYSDKLAYETINNKQYSLKDSENIETTGMVLKCALEVPRIFYRSVHIKILYSSKIYIILSYLIFLLKSVVESKLRIKYKQLLDPSTAMQLHGFL